MKINIVAMDVANDITDSRKSANTRGRNTFIT